jgi:hypothetical protein
MLDTIIVNGFLRFDVQTCRKHGAGFTSEGQVEFDTSNRSVRGGMCGGFPEVFTGVSVY